MATRPAGGRDPRFEAAVDAAGRLVPVVLLTAWALVAPTVARAESGVFDDRIVFGQSAAFEGPAAALGIGMREGILAAFAEINDAGGIDGRRLELIAYDDGYEPELAITNVQRLVDDDGVFALIGHVGTPTARAVLPIAAEQGVPFLGPFTGAAFLRDPAWSNVVNVRASYDQEIDSWIDYLTRRRGVERIAILYQDDSFGLAGLAGVDRALAEEDLELVAEGTFKRNTTAVKRALLAIRKGEPEAVVMFGAYEPIATFIRLAHEIGLAAVFVNSSFVGSTALAEELGPEGAGVVVSQVVPPPDDARLPIVRRYRRALASTAPAARPGFVSLEGYVVGRLVVEALERLGRDVTRDGLLATIRESGPFDLGGLTLVFGPGDNQGLDEVFLTEIAPDGAYVALSDAGG